MFRSFDPDDAYAWTGHGSGSTAYAVNNLDQYTTIAKVATAYDANGNMTYNPATGRTYSYTSQNLLSGVTATGVPATTLPRSSECSQ